MTEKINKGMGLNTVEFKKPEFSQKDNMQNYWDTYMQDSAMISGLAQQPIYLADASAAVDKETAKFELFKEINGIYKSASDKFLSAQGLYGEAVNYYNAGDYLKAQEFYGKSAADYKEAEAGFADVVKKGEAALVLYPDDADFAALITKANEYQNKALKNTKEAKADELDSEKAFIIKKLENNGINEAYNCRNTGVEYLDKGNAAVKAEKYIEAKKHYENASAQYKRAITLLEAIIPEYESICDKCGCTDNEKKSLDSMKKMVESMKVKIGEIDEVLKQLTNN